MNNIDESTAKTKKKSSSGLYRFTEATGTDFVFLKYRIYPDRHFEFISNNCERMTGIHQNKFYENPLIFDQIIHPDESNKLNSWRKRGIKKNDSFDFRIINRHTGKEQWLRIQIVDTYKEEDENIYAEGIVSDISLQQELADNLQKSEKLYRTTIDNISDPLHVIDSNMNMILCNKSMAEQAAEFGFDTKVIGKNLFSLFPFLGTKVRQEYKTIIDTQKPLITEEVNIIADNEVFTETVKIPIINNGRVDYILTIIKDTTKTKREQMELRRNKGDLEQQVRERTRDLTEANRQLQLFHDLVDHTNDGILVYMADTNIIFDINVTACSILESERKSVIGKNVCGVLFPESECTVQCNTERLQSEGVIQYFNIMKNASGAVKHIEVNSKLVKVEKQKYVISVIRDITHKKLAEEALQDSEERYRSVVESAGEPIFSINEDGVFTFMNTTASIAVGGRPEDFVGKSMWDVFPHQIANRQMKSVREGLSTDQKYIIKEEQTIIQGQKRWYRTSITPINSTKNSKREALLISRDITPMKEAEESFILFRKLLDQSNETILVFDPYTFEVTDANQTACDNLGYERKELLSLHMDDIEIDDSFDLTREFNNLRNTHTGIKRGTHKRKDGSTFPVEVNARIVTVMGKEYMIAVARDITDRIKVEEALRNSEERYRIVAENASDGILLTLGKRIVFANRTMHAMLQYPSRELNGANIDEILPQNIGRRKAMRYENVLSGSSPHTQSELQLCRKDGSLMDVYISTRQTRVDKQDGALVLAKDITSMKNLEQQLIRSERMAAVGTLAGGIAHEFNNIIVSILGFAQLALERDDLPTDLADWMERICKASRRGRNITQNLLHFSRQTATPTERGNLAQVARDTIDLLERQFETTDIELTTDLRPIPNTSMDSTQVGQVILNLLINARHATLGQNERKVNVSTGRKDDSIFIRVSDNGCGIPEQDLSKIFSPFFSTKGEYAGDTPQAAVKGTGLGLSISHRIAENHGGSISVVSTIGNGATFTLWLPITAAADEAKPEEEICEPMFKSANILVIDDEKDTREIVSLVLGRMGHKLSATSEAEDALEIIKEKKTDLVLVDLQMPRMGGIEFLEKASAIPEEIRPAFIIITGKATSFTHEDIKRLSISAVISKPFELTELEGTVSRALAGSQK